MAAPFEFTENSGKCLQGKRETAYNISKIDEIVKIDYQKFFEDYLIPNKPCIFEASLTERWRCRTEWVARDGSPNFDFLRTQFGKATVPVANCKQEEFSSHPKQDLSLNNYIDYWEDYRANKYPADEPCLYLKDWHFTKEFPNYEAYRTPVYFQSDWLNEFWDTLPMDDYRFVYMGPKGTWTPFHSDVYRSFSWSANICGKKKWIFYPPGCEEHLKDKLGNLIYDITPPELDKTKYPFTDKVKGRRLEVIQGQGQIIFVPSGWHHQVYNLEDTISINHNWLNGCNIDICWQHLQDNLQSVKREISDLKGMDGWNEQCQLILNASAGINYEMFIKLLKVIAVNRINALEKIQATELLLVRTTELATDKVTDTDVVTGMFESCEVTTGLSQSNINKSSSEDCGVLIEDVCKTKGTKNLHMASKSTTEANVNPDKITRELNVGKESFIGHCGDTECIESYDTPIVNCKTELDKSLIHSCSAGSAVESIKDGVENICYSSETNIPLQMEYILYDLHRIKETLTDIINDRDYKGLKFEKENSPEYLYELIESKLYLISPLAS